MSWKFPYQSLLSQVLGLFRSSAELDALYDVFVPLIGHDFVHLLLQLGLLEFESFLSCLHLFGMSLVFHFEVVFECQSIFGGRAFWFRVRRHVETPLLSISNLMLEFASLGVEEGCVRASLVGAVQIDEGDRSVGPHQDGRLKVERVGGK